jgi:hypothetical protein
MITAKDIQSTMDLLEKDKERRIALSPYKVGQLRRLVPEDVIHYEDICSPKINPNFKGAGIAPRWSLVPQHFLGKSPADWRLSNFLFATHRP